MKFDACPFCYNPLFFGNIFNEKLNTSAALQKPLPHSIIAYCTNNRCKQYYLDATHGWYTFASDEYNVITGKKNEPELVSYVLNLKWNGHDTQFVSNNRSGAHHTHMVQWGISFSPGTIDYLFKIEKYFPFPEKDAEQYFEALMKRLENLAVFL